jgi:hypothetical protein
MNPRKRGIGGRDQHQSRPRGRGGAQQQATVDDAIDKGKITASRRKHWVELLSADHGMHDVLASIPNETAVPLSEIGHASAESDTQLTPDQNPTWFY